VAESDEFAGGGAGTGPRSAGCAGRRHGLLAILLIGACAVLAGARSFVAIAEYAHDAGRAVLDVVGVGGRVPEESTIRRVLNALDAAALEAALHAWALAHLELMGPPPGTPRREQRGVLALDGKTVRGARVRATSDCGERGGESALVSRPHLLSVLDRASGVVLAQIQVEGKGSEVGVFQILLDQFDLTEVLVTADALHTNCGHADYPRERGGHYLMTVKANQPTLLRRLRALPWAQIGAQRPGTSPRSRPRRTRTTKSAA
jgi:hypothetical protein